MITWSEAVWVSLRGRGVRCLAVSDRGDDVLPPDDPSVQLARRIADTIGELIETKFAARKL